MQRLWIVLLVLAPAVSGCAVCCGVDDENYAAYGGTWQRTDMSRGRVGSAFATPGELLDPPADGETLPAPIVEEGPSVLLPPDGMLPLE